MTKLLTDPEKLAILDTKIQEFIEPEIKEIIQEAETEIFDSKNKTRNSLFARTVCQCLNQRGRIIMNTNLNNLLTDFTNSSAIIDLQHNG